MIGFRPNKTNNDYLKALGVGRVNNKAILFFSSKKHKPFNIAISDKQGLNFKPIKEKLRFPYQFQIFKNTSSGHDYHLTPIKQGYILTYLEEDNNTNQLKFRISKNLIKWSEPKKINSIYEAGKVVKINKRRKRYLVYGRKQINLGIYNKLSQKPKNQKIIYQPQEKILGQTNLKICQTFEADQGILILVYRYQDPTIWEEYSWQLIYTDKKDPGELIWTKQLPINGQIPNPENYQINPVGAVKLNNKLISYWQVGAENIYSLSQPFFQLNQPIKQNTPFPYLNKLKRYKKNPILKPRPKNKWESKLVFNPAAVNTKNKTHLIYRAVGEKDISVLGYASTTNGLQIDERLNKPVYQPKKNFEINRQAPKITYSYTSGWGCGGCEDPKLTKIGSKIYMTYTAWNGVDPPGVALTSISENDLNNKKWNWTEPIMISPPGEIHKNWAVFPEKINKRFAILHSLSPKILVDYVDDLNFKDQKYIKSYYKPSGRKNHWDNWMRGAGPPPMKTDDGWLLLYHAMDNRDPGRYKLGAMVLNHQNPTEIEYRSNYPLLEPDMNYENEGFKSGVVYSCGAVIKNQRLFVYYGGADTVSCAAHIKINTLLSDLKNQNRSELSKAIIYN
jgi:beta-1,2-mannobiose phosphorylase / 1,2-beta-oligomannan phosphorylase